MRMLLTRDDSGHRCAPLEDDGTPAGPAFTGRTPAEVAELEARHHPRWVWPATSSAYPALLRDGVRLERCHDLALTENLLRPHEGRPPVAATPGAQDDLFATLADPRPATDLVTEHAEQLARIARARSTSPGFGLLVAAESAAALAAAEMGHTGLPWDVAEHDRALTELLGSRPRHGGRPPVLQALAVEVGEALDAPLLNLDSPQELVKALGRAGLPVRSTRARELETLDHPAIPPLLRYKELARLHVAHGWAWQEQWVQGGRFHPEYVPGGVVSGRWATRGGGALQLPRQLRGAVSAAPGHKLVVADAGQLEPRVLAALSRDPAMIEATRAGDLYTALADQLGGAATRPEVKIALLSVMYGGGTRSAALVAMRRRYPQALAMLERAARIGEDGGTVTSVLGRTCPAAGDDWTADDETRRARGRFTRNFVIQASAADWANVLVAELRRRLAGTPAELVFFQHDEVMVHAPASRVPEVVTAVADAGAAATRLVLGETGVAVPLNAVPVDRYAEKP